MDCCNYGEYRAHSHAQYAGGGGGGGGGAGAWDGYNAPYGLPYAPYTPYAHAYYAHDHYARYNAFRYDHTAHHATHNDHAMPMDYGPYASKEVRARRAVARRDARARSTIQHLPLPPTPPLDCGMNGRSPGYCEPQMWHHYQMGVMNGGGWSGGASAWNSRGLSCSREQIRYPPDFRSIKGSHAHVSNMAYPDGRSTPFMYDEHYGAETASMRYGSGSGGSSGVGSMVESMPSRCAAQARSELVRSGRERASVPARPSPPVEKPRPAIVPLPAFQQAFGSTEIGKFAEAFSRTEIALDDETFPYESFSEWEGTAEPQWSAQPTQREIKCEDSF